MLLSTFVLGAAILGKPTSPPPPELVVTMSSGKSFVISTDPKNAPKSVTRILQLVGKKFYDGQRFHRVEDWVVQWGAPQSKKSVDDPGVGNGGSGTNMPFEAGKLSFARGVCGVASTGKRLGGDSQLFIVKRDSQFLNGDYCAWGKVVSGMNVVDGIKRGDKIKSITVRTATKVKR